MVGEWVLVENLGEGKGGPAMVHIPLRVFVILFKTLPLCDSYYIASTQSLFGLSTKSRLGGNRDDELASREGS